MREAAEETGVLLDPADLVPLATLHRTNGGDGPRARRADSFFAAGLRRGEARITEPDNCAAMEWFELQHPPRPMPEHERYVLRHLAAGALPAIASLGFTR